MELEYDACEGVAAENLTWVLGSPGRSGASKMSRYPAVKDAGFGCRAAIACVEEVVAQVDALAVCWWACASEGAWSWCGGLRDGVGSIARCKLSMSAVA